MTEAISLTNSNPNDPVFRMTEVTLIFPHQLFKKHPAIHKGTKQVVLIEHPLFFGDKQYPALMHKQKLAYHRATMAAFKQSLEKKDLHCTLLPYNKGIEPLPELLKTVSSQGHKSIALAEVHDFILNRRLEQAAKQAGLKLEVFQSPGFLNSAEENKNWRSTRKRWFMADFYQSQRKRLNILVEDNKPIGGKWSFDDENRRKLPAKLLGSIPEIPTVRRTAEIDAAIKSVATEFPDNPGALERWYYPTTAASAERWLMSFLEQRFHLFGEYEDAIVEDQNFLYHSILTPMLNTGLLTPAIVVSRTLAHAEAHNIPLNSVEGFIRQIIGWREFMRATYDDLGVTMRTTNHWQHTRAMPDAFYNGSTGILPVDNTIERILKTGYCHHIERLMILGGFMFLCEIDPDDIYKWFMEMFIDSYDWVMVPNVYAMSQNADGGNITTKPYFSGSNYVIKMSHYKKSEWSETWDALFWRWIIRNSDQLKTNHRWAMMVRNAEKMDTVKRNLHLKIAEDYLQTL